MIIASTPTSPPSTNHLDYYRTFSTGFFTSSPAHHSKLQSTHRNQRDPFETQVHSSVEISRRVSVSLKTKPKPSPESAGPTDHLPGSFLLHASFSALQLLHPLAVSGTCQAHICLRAFTHVSPYAQNILCLHSRLFVSLHFSAMSPLWGGLPYLCPLSCLFLSHGQGCLACCGPWGCKESDTTEGLNNESYTMFPVRTYKIKLVHDGTSNS